MNTEDRKSNVADDGNLDATVFLSRSLELEKEEIDFSLNNVEHLANTEDQERYRFICYFAAGGMGKLSKALDLTFDRIVAVKTLKDTLKNDSFAIKSFLEEGRLNAQLDHPSIIPVYTMGKSKNDEWEVVTKFIHGMSLTKFIHESRHIYEDQKIGYRQEKHAILSRLEYFLKICEVVNYCHSRHIVHGDLKPDNIMIGQYGELYVMDWGCARKMGTVPDQVSGTPHYMPPEFLRDKKVTALIDVYALGMILFELVTLQRKKIPPKDKDFAHAFRASLHETQSWNYQSGLQVNPAMKAIIIKALEPDPSKRYQSVKELTDDIRHIMFDEEVSVYPDNLVRKLSRVIYRHRIKTVIGLSLMFLIFITALVVSYFNFQKIEQHRNLVQRLKFETYTDDLAAAIENNLLSCQSQLMLLADNMQWALKIAPDKDKIPFVDNEQYKDPKTAPSGMFESPGYLHPITVDNIVRIKVLASNQTELKLPGAGQFVDISHKVIFAKLDNPYIHNSVDIKTELQSDNNFIQRVFMLWANGIGYSFPGCYEDPESITYQKIWGTSESHFDAKQITWSKPYNIDRRKYWMICRYPVFARDGRYIGTAGLELRVNRILAPLLNAHINDPDHQFYVIDGTGYPAMIQGENIILPDEKDLFPDGTSSQTVVDISKKLIANDYQQFDTMVNDIPHFISGAPLPIFNGTFFQMIDADAVTKHYHEK